jgi:large-conductance mechanosensitive channel
MNFWFALLISVVAGFIFGKSVKPKGKKFSWGVFLIAMFILLGGLKLIFGIAFGALLFLKWLIDLLFWIAVWIFIVWLLVKLYKKAKNKASTSPTTEEPPKEEPPPQEPGPPGLP